MTALVCRLHSLTALFTIYPCKRIDSAYITRTPQSFRAAALCVERHWINRVRCPAATLTVE
eukprot:m.42859 g.42859  ORF g.42859 m.42859 type:complete len:61 (+) comp10741_c0_seq3:5867-6049(+)